VVAKKANLTSAMICIVSLRERIPPNEEPTYADRIVFTRKKNEFRRVRQTTSLGLRWCEAEEASAYNRLYREMNFDCGTRHSGLRRCR